MDQGQMPNLARHFDTLLLLEGSGSRGLAGGPLASMPITLFWGLIRRGISCVDKASSRKM